MSHLTEAQAALSELSTTAQKVVQAIAECKPHLGAPNGLDTVEEWASKLVNQVAAVQEQLTAHSTVEDANPVVPVAETPVGTNAQTGEPVSEIHPAGTDGVDPTEPPVSDPLEPNKPSKGSK